MEEKIKGTRGSIKKEMNLKGQPHEKVCEVITLNDGKGPN
jgi:hypothetical protein